jgi:transposase InsO family protein
MRYRAKTGVSMQVRGEIIPGAGRIRRALPKATGEVRVEARLSRAALGRLRVLRWSEAHGGAVRATCQRFGLSTSTFLLWRGRYRTGGPTALEEWTRRPRRVRRPTWDRDLEEAVRVLRVAFPRWGKDKLVPLLAHEGRHVSASMVGRILRQLKEQGRLREASLRDPCIVRQRRPRPHAVRKPKSYLPCAPGDLVQVDSSDVRPTNGVHYKHFSARDVVCKWDVLDVFDRATASAAARFLEALIRRSPYQVRAIQVDGGSEFKADFERLCQERSIQLFVLPPRSPKLNGGVERAQRTHKEEFYELVDLPPTIGELRRKLLRHEEIYNTVRPHQTLGQRTPWAWLQEHQKQKTDCSPEASARFPNPYRQTTT